MPEKPRAETDRPDNCSRRTSLRTRQTTAPRTHEDSAPLEFVATDRRNTPGRSALRSSRPLSSEHTHPVRGLARGTGNRPQATPTISRHLRIGFPNPGRDRPVVASSTGEVQPEDERAMTHRAAAWRAHAPRSKKESDCTG